MSSLERYVSKGGFYKAVVDDGNDLIFIVDYNGRILYCNKAVRSTLGHSDKGLIGRFFFDFLPAHSAAGFKSSFAKSCKRAYQAQVEFQFLCKDKTFRYLEYNSINLAHKDGIDGLILDCRDITQRKQDAEAILQAQKAKDQFLANISHEIRTPINGIAGMANLLSQNPSTEDHHSYLQAITAAAENLKVIINDILDLASIESGKLKFEKIGFKLDDNINSVIKIFSLQAREKGIALKSSIEKGLHDLILIGDPFRLNQVVINLLSNAIKFTHYGQITLQATLQRKAKAQAWVSISVKDTGIGIQAGKLKTIFERFSQADETITRKFGGTGLGLTIVKQLVDFQKGTIDVKSVENEGSTFNVTIPYRIGVSSDLGGGSEGTKIGNSHKRRHTQVLLVEDNDINRLYAATILKNWGCHVESAENGQVALELVKLQTFDVILMDIQMPVMDGFEATKALRAIHPPIKTPIVALTANVSALDKQACLRAGMDDCLGKPFTPEELDHVLKQVLQRKGQSAAEQPTDLNLGRIRKVSNNNPTFVREMIKTFLDTLPGSLVAIQKHAEAGEFDAMAKVIHKVKPSLSLMGADHLRKEAMHLEASAKAKKSTDAIRSQAQEFVARINNLVLALKEELKKA